MCEICKDFDRAFQFNVTIFTAERFELNKLEKDKVKYCPKCGRRLNKGAKESEVV